MPTASFESTSQPRSPIAHIVNWFAPIAIILAAVVLALLAGWNNSATADEPYHTLAGFTYVTEGHGDLNPEHPPLIKLISGLALAPYGLRSTESPPVARLDRLGEEVRRFIFNNSLPSATLLTIARLPELLFLIALLCGVYLWARFFMSRRAAVVALVAVASQPLVLGHSFIVHTDVPAAAAWTWTLFLLHRWLAGWRHGWFGVGCTLAIALLTKFSSVYLAVVVVLAVLVYVLNKRTYRILLGLVGSGVVCSALVWIGMLPGLRNVSAEEEKQTIAKYLSLWPETVNLSSQLQAVADHSVPIAHYALGLAYVKQTNEHGQGINLFLGEKRIQGFALYFPVALALKTSLPFLLASVWGLAIAIRRRKPIQLALLGAVVYYFAISFGTSYNIGARHLMPVIPLLALLIGYAFDGIGRMSVLALILSLAASPLVSFPHYIAHFSMLVGGATNGARFLNDSNLDWGQDWRRLAVEAKRNGWYPLSYAYLGAGYPADELSNSQDSMEAHGLPSNSYIAVSSFTASVGVDYLGALGNQEDALHLQAILKLVEQSGLEVGDIGHTIKIYRIE